MSLKVFLSYSVDPEDQAIIWRLQTLAAANGINFYVPLWRMTEQRRPGHLPAIVRSQIDEADCVLAIITIRTGPNVKSELNYAVAQNRLLVVLIEDSVPTPPFLKQLPGVFRFSRTEPPGQVENQVVAFLKDQELTKERKKALGAVVGIGLGLLLLSALQQE
jgi:hypothetical protein